MTAWKIEHNDVIEWAKNYDGQPFHAMFADCPYHLTSISKRFSKPESKPPKGGVYKRTSNGFMNSVWDQVDEKGMGISFDPATWEALAEHLYPGAFGMTFASSRTHHRIACAIEDAGLIIQPTIYGYCYLSGFPKATQISSQIDRAAKTEGAYSEGADGKNSPTVSTYNKGLNVNFEARRQYQPATPLARDWAGHRYGGQALKPMLEPLICFSKPYEGRPVDCIVKTGAGALNIDGGRIGTGVNDDFGRSPYKADGTRSESRSGHSGLNGLHTEATLTPQGRWPGNLYLHHSKLCRPAACTEDCAVRLFDEAAGETVSGQPSGTRNATTGFSSGITPGAYDLTGYGDSGPASRMMFRGDWSYEVAEALVSTVERQLAQAEPLRYGPKASSSERVMGLEGMTNNHPTVKSISVCKYFATLLLPPAAYAPRRILVPFSGVSSEMIGAMLAGFEEVIGIEQSSEYAAIGEARMKWWSQWPGWGQTDVDTILATAGKEGPVQLPMFSGGIE